ncbi:MAG: nucleotidyltransferase domain-containing protein [Ruminococcus sp.]|nr:nucleotidyltransferase domain-containing protein [Ruminococcus sp.]
MEIAGRIQQKLDELERQEGIRILHCIESGSRAWGFASPDSDYDVRFIYARPEEYYLRLGKTCDHIDYELNDVYDINGWDIQKTLRLLHKSNPTLFEWNNSPVVYRTTAEWQRVSSITSDYFQSPAGIYHYLSMARSNYREYLKGDEVRLKKYFYVIRPILACLWIMHRNSPPPMLFSQLKEAELEKPLVPVVDELLQKKMAAPELGTGRRIGVLNEYIERQLNELEERAAKMEKSLAPGWEELDKIFTEIVKGN